MKISGPIGMHEYLGHGKFKSGKKELSCKKLGEVWKLAAGSFVCSSAKKVS